MTGGQMIKEPPRVPDEKLFAYLQEMTRQVNYALAQADAATVKIVERAVSQGVSQSEKTQLAKQAQEALKLRGLILQTAEQIQTVYDEKIETLTSSLKALSEQFGEYESTIVRTIEDTALGQLNTYQVFESIDDLNNKADSFDEYTVNQELYIRTGILFQDENDLTYKVGVAVGESLATVTIDGEEVLRRENVCATFTPDRLSFWQNGQEVAYFSNKKLYVQDVEYTNRLSVGAWEFKRDDNEGLVIRYTGAAT